MDPYSCAARSTLQSLNVGRPKSLDPAPVAGHTARLLLKRPDMRTHGEIPHGPVEASPVTGTRRDAAPVPAARAADLRQRLDNLARSLPHMNASDRFAAESHIAQLDEALRRLGQ